MDPRISFSTDFVDAQQAMNMKQHEGKIYREAPVSSDFEFCVKNYAMISADEVFSQGMLVPVKSSACAANKSMTSKKMTTTLRDELLVSEDLYHDVLPGVPKSSSFRWKERLGLRRAASIKKDKNDGFAQRVAEEESPGKDNLGLFYERGQKMCRSLQ